MLSPNDRVLKERYLQKYIYNDLENMNVGFDTPSIRYFKESDFAKVLERVEKCGIGIYGIEPHFYNAISESIEFFSVDTFESYSSYPQDSKWYKASFSKFKATKETLLYSASYYVPGNFFERYE